MNEHRDLTDEIVDVACRYVLGTLSDDELRSYEEHLQAECEICRKQVEWFRPVAEALALVVAPVSPPQSVRSKLLLRIRNETTQKTLPGYRFSRREEEQWTPTGVPGVQSRTLAAEAGFKTILLQCDPGARFPAHLHTGVEHIYVVSGSYECGGLRLEEGDFQRAEADTEHCDLLSENGCLLLVTSTGPVVFTTQ